MATRTRTTGFTRILLMLALMAALYFGVHYALSNTSWGQQLHEGIQQAVPADE